MERFNHKPFSFQHIEEVRRERVRDDLFNQLIAGRVLDEFYDDLSSADFPDEAFDEFESAFAELEEEDKRAVLAIPAQLRPLQFKRYGERVRNENMTGADVLADILQKANQHGYTLGFHLSLTEIRPAKDGSWYIRGTEPDHRHNDLPMAYYSKDYSDRYKDKRVRYLYVIRAETGEGTSHYQDLDGSWGHASSLSIISRVDMFELEKELETRYEASEAENRKGGAQMIASPPPQSASM